MSQENYCPMCGTELNSGNCPNCGYQSPVSAGPVVSEQNDSNSTGSTTARSKKKTIIPILIIAVIAAAIVVVLLVIKLNDKPTPFVNEEVEEPRVIQVGDIITLGSYEQDNNSGNGSEEIEWIVLAKEDNRVLVISKDILDYRSYDDGGDYYDYAWQSCSLRTWLNSSFLNTAFTNDEQAIILAVTVETDDYNPTGSYEIFDETYHFNEPDSNDTVDRLFLLGAGEAYHYFISDYDRISQLTAYANSLNANGDNSWWLRSLGSSNHSAAFVFRDGDVDTMGLSVNLNDLGVRPAMWIDVTNFDSTQVQATSANEGINSVEHPIDK